jgi:DNA-binding NtrC family response regulator
MPRVLVVDDEEQIRNMLKRILIQAGHEVHTASNAKAAIEIAQPDPFDVLISDVIMPGMDGHDLARWFASTCPKSRVILMSAFDPGCQECPFLDNCHRLSKPFLPKDVIGLVSDVLAQPPRSRRIDGYPENEGRE